MGIFSLFGKKDVQRKNTSASRKSGKNNGRTNTASSVTENTPPQHSQEQQWHIARATEKKIDEIESEMTRDIAEKRKPKLAASAPRQTKKSKKKAVLSSGNTLYNVNTTLPAIGAETEYLFDSPNNLTTTPIEQTESIPALEEAAILFASGQPEAAEKALQQIAHQDNTKATNQTAWWMLFDL